MKRWSEKLRFLPAFELEIQYGWHFVCVCVDKLCLQNKWRLEQLTGKYK